MGRWDLRHQCRCPDVFRKVAGRVAARRGGDSIGNDSKSPPVYAHETAALSGEKEGRSITSSRTLSIPGKGRVRSGARQADRFPAGFPESIGASFPFLSNTTSKMNAS